MFNNIVRLKQLFIPGLRVYVVIVHFNVFVVVVVLVEFFCTNCASR